MKKIYIAMAAIATLMLASCVQEMPENGQNGIETLGKNDIAFAIKGTVSTRSGADVIAPVKTVDIAMGEPENGVSYYLEESVTRLDGPYAVAPETRGTPAYTGNLDSLYGSFNAVAYPVGTIAEDAKPTIADGPYVKIENSDLWTRKFNSDPWPAGDNPELYFFMRMPGNPAGVQGAYTYSYANSKGSISFTYKSPATAEQQQDILFSGRPIKKQECTTPNSAPVLFHHALTGVKFATDNHISSLSGGTKTYITKVEFVGLKGSGTCTVTPIQENGYHDDPNSYSSATAVTWTGVSAVEGATYSQEFDPDNYAKNIYSEHYDYDNGGTNYGYFPDSFYANDNAYSKEKNGTERRVSDWNINDGNASQTFWFIPQDFGKDADLANVQLKVTFIIDAGGKRSQPITRVIDNFGAVLSAAKVNWQAGELRTYTLKATEVAVTVEDEMLDADTKHMVQIRNMGNVPEWVRATVTANWCIYVDADGNYVDPTGKTADQLRAYEQVAVYGYKTDTGDEFMDPWRLETEISSSPRYGTFYKSDGVVGFPATGWQAGPGGYYYYTNYIGVDEAATYNLFYSYIVTAANKPTVWLVNHKTFQRYQVEVHLVMDVLVQAILAETDSDGNVIAGETWQTAWNRALANGE